MSLPRNVAETAAHIYRDVGEDEGRKSKVDNGDDLGVRIPRVQAVRRQQDPEGGGESIRDGEGAVAKVLRLIRKDVETGYVPPPSVEKHISKLVNLAKIDQRVEHLALSVSRQTNDSKISSGKAPAGLAAAYVYMSSVMRGDAPPPARGRRVRRSDRGDGQEQVQGAAGQLRYTTEDGVDRVVGEGGKGQGRKRRKDRKRRSAKAQLQGTRAKADQRQRQAASPKDGEERGGTGGPDLEGVQAGGGDAGRTASSRARSGRN